MRVLFVSRGEYNLWLLALLVCEGPNTPEKTGTALGIDILTGPLMVVLQSSVGCFGSAEPQDLALHALLLVHEGDICRY